MTDREEHGRRAMETVEVIDPSQIHVTVNERGEVRVQYVDGATYDDVNVVPAFPITRPNRFVYLQEADGKELGLLVDPRRLDRESHDVVLNQADQAYFMPRITRIIRVEERMGMGLAHWEVETDRGYNSFDIVSRSESVWYVGRDRLVIRDADGNRYLIEDLSALDKRSRRLADLYL